MLAASIALIYAALPGPLQAQAWQPGTNVLYTTPSSVIVGVGTANPLISLDVRTGSLPQMGIAGTTDYLTFFASDAFGPAIYWDPNKAMRFGKGGTALYSATGFQEQMRIQPNGNVGIGTTNPLYKLSVIGIVHANEVIVDTATADYVFAPDYRLTPLSEVAAYIQEYHHLPEIPSAKDVEAKGVSLGEMQAKLLAKIEELTLHMIQADERNDRLEQQNRELQEKFARLETRESKGGAGRTPNERR